jgi:hypothetical protein
VSGVGARCCWRRRAQPAQHRYLGQPDRLTLEHAEQFEDLRHDRLGERLQARVETSLEQMPALYCSARGRSARPRWCCRSRRPGARARGSRAMMATRSSRMFRLNRTRTSLQRAFQRDGSRLETSDQLLVYRHQPRVQMARQRDELAIIGGASARTRQREYVQRTHVVLAPGHQ